MLKTILGLAALAGLAAAQAAVNPAAALLEQARAAARELPANAEPVFLSVIAQNEIQPSPEGAAEDAAAAFRGAMMLPAEDDADRKAVVGPALLVLGLLKRRELALQLVRESQPVAGMSKADLYNGLVFLQMKAAPEQTVALVEECEQADGSFPFALADAALANKAIQPEQSSALESEGLAAAGRATAQAAEQMALLFLTSVERRDPARREAVESVVTGQLQRLGRADNTPDNVSLGRRYLALLQKLDPDRANELKSNLTSFAAPAASLPSIGGISMAADARGNLQIHFPKYMNVILSAPEQAEKDPETPVTRAAALAEPMDRFRALCGVAEVLAHARHPQQAREAAEAALAMVGNPIQLESDQLPGATDGTPGVPVESALDSPLIAATELAGTLEKVGEADAARSLLDRCLGVADREAATLDSEYGVDTLRQAGKAEELPRRTFVLNAVYSQAAGADFALAAGHAQGLRSPAVRALILASIAGGWKAAGVAQ